MKQFYLKIFIVGLFSILGLQASAYDAKIDGIYYKFNKTAKTAEVTYESLRDSYYSGIVSIPSSVVYQNETYSVITIGDFSFKDCSGLTSITIPNSVTTIGQSAFRDCDGLTSITIPNSVTTIGQSAFRNCDGLTSITIPNSVTTIEDSTFYYCISLRSITIPNSVTSIGKWAFAYCRYLTPVMIPNSVISIGVSAFFDCDGLKSITIPNSLISIGDCAFMYCTGLTSITIPNSVTCIGGDAFYGTPWFDNQPDGLIYIGKVAYKYKGEMPSNTNITLKEGTVGIAGYAFSGCTGLTSINIPNSVTNIGSKAFYDCKNMLEIVLGRNVRQIGENVFAQHISFNSADGWNGSKVGCKNMSIYTESGSATLLSLWNDNGLTYYYIRTYSNGRSDTEFERVNDRIYDMKEKGKYKKRLNPFFKTTPSSIDIMHYDNDIIVKREIEEYSEANFPFTGLEPKTSFYMGDVTLTFKRLDGTYCTLSGYGSFSNDDVFFHTLQPRVVSSGNVIVAADTNLDDEEEKVGFEWRRTDWTDDFASNTGGAYLYDGMMEGYIRNLNAEKLWKVRPYYESAAGNRYYGEWMGLDPTNTSYFEPTVHTYAKITVDGNSAQVKGYAMRGSDNVTQQGFMYWKVGGSARAAVGAKAPSVPKDAMIVEAKGQIMTAELTGLDYQSQYCCVAFITTSENETFYGEVQSFRTGIDVNGVEDVTTASDNVTEMCRYDMDGRRLDAPQRGLNIIRMSDGTVRKVMVK